VEFLIKKSRSGSLVALIKSIATAADEAETSSVGNFFFLRWALLFIHQIARWKHHVDSENDGNTVDNSIRGVCCTPMAERRSASTITIFMNEVKSITRKGKMATKMRIAA